MTKLKPGDRVLIFRARVKGRLLAIHGEEAWVLMDEGKECSTWDLSDLKRLRKKGEKSVRVTKFKIYSALDKIGYRNFKDTEVFDKLLKELGL